MKIYTDNLLETFSIMGIGMFGIFLVTAIIVFTIFLLNKLTARKPKEHSENSDSDTGKS